jgi:hypothetical protein
LACCLSSASSALSRQASASRGGPSCATGDARTTRTTHTHAHAPARPAHGRPCPSSLPSPPCAASTTRSRWASRSA